MQRQHLIAIDLIQVSPDRQRREFRESEIQALATSIQAIGLLHPIVLRNSEDGPQTLVAGERRLRAIRDIYELGGSFSYAGEPVPPGHIPYTPLGELSPIEAMEAELEENIRRVDLTWQERAEATGKLQALRQAQSEDRGLPTPTVASLAEEIRGKSKGTDYNETRKELLISRHLDKPEVAAAKTLDEAFKALKREEQKTKQAKLAETVGKVFSSSDHKLLNVDAIEWLKGQAPNQFDVILTDPPYGMGADSFGDAGKDSAYAEHGYEDSPENFQTLMEAFAPLSFSLTKPDAHLYLFCDIDWFLYLKNLFSSAGWQVFRTPLIWFKPSAYRAPWPDQGPQRKYECILYAVKGDKKCLRLGGDVLQHAPDENIGHSAQKPVALFQDLLSRSASPGERVLDICCGSGPIFPAATALKVYATGLEVSSEHYALALSRLKETS